MHAAAPGGVADRDRDRASCCSTCCSSACSKLVTVPLFLVLMGAPPPRWGPFLADARRSGTVSLAASSTLVGAVIAQTRGRGALFAGDLAAAAAAGARGGGDGHARRCGAGTPVAPPLRLLAAYAVALLAVSLLLYDHLWED